MRYFLLMLTIVLLGAAIAQPVVVVPDSATQFDSLKIFFDATEGDGGLAGYTGDVYAHTGVITNYSSGPGDWKGVVGSWGNNTTQPRLTPVGSDLYELEIGIPRDFYSITDPTEQILQLAFVFRSDDGSQTGRDVGGADIFVGLYSQLVGAVVVQPVVSTPFGLPQRSPAFTSQQDTLAIEISTRPAGPRAAQITLFVDNNQIAQVQTDVLTYDLIGSSYSVGFHDVSAIVEDSLSNADTVNFALMVNPVQTSSAPPAGTPPGINYTSNSSATVALFAPQKKFVYFLSELSNWEVDLSYLMNRYDAGPDSVLWWLELNGLTAGQEYAFQYLVDGDIRIADPYAEKILDKFNDPFIPPSTYPNLMPYPDGKTDRIVSVLQTNQAPFTWVYSDTFQRADQKELVVYELLLRDFVDAHDYQTLIDTLDYMKNLGVNAVELMPFNEFEGNISWGYNPSFMFAPDKFYGTEDDLKWLIDECHRRGLAVIMDIVLNHNYGQSPLVRLYWDEVNNRPAANSPWFNQVSPNPVFSFGYDFNHESVHTKALVDRVNRYWLEEHRIDGYRFDFTKGFTQTPGDGGARDNARIAILERMADQIWAVDSSAYVILEHFAENSEERDLSNHGRGMLLWGNHNYNYNEATMGYHDNGKSDFSGAYYGTRNWQQAHLVAYMESHDEERLMYKNLQYGNSSGNYNVQNLATALERIKIASAFFFTIPGPKMIWQFGELGYDFSINYPCNTGNCRTDPKPIRWDYLQDGDRSRIYRVFQALLKLRRENEVFRSEQTGVDLFLGSASGLKRIRLAHPQMNAVIVGNFGVTQQGMAGNFHHTGMWYDYFTGDSLDVTVLSEQIIMNPGVFHLYTDQRLESPEPGLVTGIGDVLSDGGVPAAFQLYGNYPDRFKSPTTIVCDVAANSRVTLTVFNILGQQVRQLVDGDFLPGRHRMIWDARDDRGQSVASGLYFLQMKASAYVSYQRMMLLR